MTASVFDPNFKYTESVATNIMDTWIKHGFKPRPAPQEEELTLDQAKEKIAKLEKQLAKLKNSK